MSNGAAITIHGLCKSYGEKNVLKDLDISVKEASVTAIAGPSGCGKTTLLRIISGLESADKGQILISGQPVMMFQEPRLFNHLSAIENVLCVISPKIENIRKNAEDLLFRMGIDEKSQKLFPYQLSGGMQQRVSLTRTLLYDKAPIILLDEPLNGVDTDMKNKLYPVIKEYSQGKTVLMVSHDENDVKALSDNTIHLDFADNIG